MAQRGPSWDSGRRQEEARVDGRRRGTIEMAAAMAISGTIGWVVVTGIGMELARLMATRAAARQWAKGTGELPSHLRTEA